MYLFATEGPQSLGNEGAGARQVETDLGMGMELMAPGDEVGRCRAEFDRLMHVRIVSLS
jgi:hypothetical protein